MKHVILTLTLAGAVALAGCAADRGAGADGLSGTFRQAGSSTVLPVAQAWAEEFNAIHPGVQLVVSGGGTGAGFKQFCRGEVDVADASRPIKEAERQECAANGVEPREVQVAIDGLAVVVARSNEFVDHLTVEELNRLWTADASRQATTWRDLRPEWPDEEVDLFGPGTDSGTFDYFVEVVIAPFDGPQSMGRSDYTPSEDDNVLVQGVARSPHGLGYFGLAYAHENADKVRIVPIDEGKGRGPVEPTPENVESGAYSPLARPIYMYVDGKPTGALLAYFEFGLGEDGQALVEEVGYIRVPAATREAILADLRG